ncbi:hypothetical protein [Erythrobacter rubeus]|uniref:Uncharacterized protein n=1 Tax=Erythrobacter rubeus TaxID=2760803 RepID=A0ABR8KUE6_9SPHN|nr:hypothetical protein [Erythrobacter rubeus]MBD2842688.1 hypothetical protein [Erythrobacter rubeus]
MHNIHGGFADLAEAVYSDDLAKARLILDGMNTDLTRRAKRKAGLVSASTLEAPVREQFPRPGAKPGDMLGPKTKRRNKRAA